MEPDWLKIVFVTSHLGTIWKTHILIRL